MEPYMTMADWTNQPWQKTLQWAIDNHVSEFDNKNTTIPSWIMPSVQDMLTKIGYRYVLNEARYPDEVAAGGNLNLTLDWTNKGNAPIYADRHLLVKIGSKVIDTGKSFEGFLPGTRTDTLTLDTTGLPVGVYPIQIGLAPPGGSPDITLAIQGTGPWYSLGTVSVCVAGDIPQADLQRFFRRRDGARWRRRLSPSLMPTTRESTPPRSVTTTSW